jgi:hypothetical protein
MVSYVLTRGLVSKVRTVARAAGAAARARAPLRRRREAEGRVDGAMGYMRGRE